MSSSSYDLSKTKRIFETKRKLTANKKLATGWVLVGVVALENGFIYSLALPNHRSCSTAGPLDTGQKEVHWLLR